MVPLLLISMIKESNQVCLESPVKEVLYKVRVRFNIIIAYVKKHFNPVTKLYKDGKS